MGKRVKRLISCFSFRSSELEAFCRDGELEVDHLIHKTSTPLHINQSVPHRIKCSNKIGLLIKYEDQMGHKSKLGWGGEWLQQIHLRANKQNHQNKQTPRHQTHTSARFSYLYLVIRSSLFLGAFLVITFVFKTPRGVVLLRSISIHTTHHTILPPTCDPIGLLQGMSFSPDHNI